MSMRYVSGAPASVTSAPTMICAADVSVLQMKMPLNVGMSPSMRMIAILVLALWWIACGSAAGLVRWA